MNRLTIDTLKSSEDTEIIKYKILGSLKEYSANLRKNKLYPTMTELVSLSVKIENYIMQSVGPNESSESYYKESDEDICIFGNLDSGEEAFDEFSNLIMWAQAQLNPILNEGIAIFEFVDENIDLQIINGTSINKDNGYILIPDNIENSLNIYSFHCILFNTNSAPIKSITTVFQKSIPMITADKIVSQVNILVNEMEDKSLPVFYCNTDLDFPYEETIFQIAKKKLLRALSM